MYRTLLSFFRRISKALPASRLSSRDESVCPITDFVVCLMIAASPAAALAQQPDSVATLRGTVVDARTGVPLPKVLVALDGGSATETAADGTFTLDRIAPGVARLYVSAVGYGLVQRSITLPAGGALDIRIPLAEGASTYTEELTVAGDRFLPPAPGVPSQQALGSADLQNLRGVLADDALRAVQVLPGVATGDDFRSEFSVRGGDFSHMNFTVDGFATPFLMHMVRAVEERANTGSVAMINSDVLETVVLLNGGYAQRSGNRTGAELAFTLREGSRERTLFRASVSGTSASATAEGPLGRSRRGSWLVSGRKSYLDLVLDRLREEGLSFGFADMQGKLRYDLTARQSASLTVVTGTSRLEEVPQAGDDSGVFMGTNRSTLVIGGWRTAFRRGTASAGTMVAGNRFRNHTAGFTFEEGTSRQIAARADVTLAAPGGLDVEGGVLLEHTGEFEHRQRRPASGAPRVTNDYDDKAMRTGAYVRVRLGAGRGLTLLPGVRADYSALTRQSTTSPWLQAEWQFPRAIVVRGAAGLYQQFPDFKAVVGSWAGEGVGPERAVHADLSVEARVSSAVRAQIALYNRADDRFLRRAGAETRLVGGLVTRGSLTAPYANRLRGHARGIEALVQRSSPAGLSGWLSYAYGRNRYDDTVSMETFWGDLDQRHTFNAYGFYRLSHRFSGSLKFRAGTNFPIPGYYAKEGETYAVSERRNELRLPSYARLDARVNRTFDWSRKRLTVFAEVLNVLNRENVRFNPPRVNTATGQVTRLFESLVPVVPSAGVLLEF